MLIRTIFTGLFLCIPITFSHAVGQPYTASHDDRVALNDIEIYFSVKTSSNGMIAPTIRITNITTTPIIIAAPDARLSIAFIVLDSLGNLVLPTGRAKADPKTQSIGIEPHKSIEYKWDKLEFVSGSALFGYDLVPGNTYRILAIYRPNGPQGDGICSREIIVTVK